jgi:hypothetical protein
MILLSQTKGLDRLSQRRMLIISHHYKVRVWMLLWPSLRIMVIRGMNILRIISCSKMGIYLKMMFNLGCYFCLVTLRLTQVSLSTI